MKRYLGFAFAAILLGMGFQNCSQNGFQDSASEAPDADLIEANQQISRDISQDNTKGIFNLFGYVCDFTIQAVSEDGYQLLVSGPPTRPGGFPNFSSDLEKITSYGNTLVACVTNANVAQALSRICRTEYTGYKFGQASYIKAFPSKGIIKVGYGSLDLNDRNGYITVPDYPYDCIYF